MVNKKITIDDLARMIKKGFDENTEQHRQIFNLLNNHTDLLNNHTDLLNNHTERLDRIEKRLEGVVYRREFDELKGRVDALENLLTVKKKT